MPARDDRARSRPAGGAASLPATSSRSASGVAGAEPEPAAEAEAKPLARAAACRPRRACPRGVAEAHLEPRRRRRGQRQDRRRGAAGVGAAAGSTPAQPPRSRRRRWSGGAPVPAAVAETPRDEAQTRRTSTAASPASAAGTKRRGSYGRCGPGRHGHVLGTTGKARAVARRASAWPSSPRSRRTCAGSPRVGLAGQLVEALVLERAEVARPDLRLLLDRSSVRPRADARLPQLAPEPARDRCTTSASFAAGVADDPRGVRSFAVRPTLGRVIRARGLEKRYGDKRVLARRRPRRASRRLRASSRARTAPARRRCCASWPASPRRPAATLEVAVERGRIGFLAHEPLVYRELTRAREPRALRPPLPRARAARAHRDAARALRPLGGAPRARRLVLARDAAAARALPDAPPRSRAAAPGRAVQRARRGRGGAARPRARRAAGTSGRSSSPRTTPSGSASLATGRVAFA